MPNIDISRDATDPRKHYHGVRMQQGRVLTDDDFNDAARLAEEGARRTVVDTIGSAGSPDDGFKLALDAKNNLILSPGTFYVGGHRLEIDDPAGEQFNHQKDWLQQGTSDQLPTTGSGYDFIYLEVWEQPVTAVEDDEILEMALGGPDTSARVRTMRRARALKLSTSGTPSCEDGWKALNSSPHIQSLGSLGDSCGSSSDGGGDYCMVTTNATLSVASNTSGPQGDLCSPEPNGGYLGAENQAIRVQITTDSTNPS